MLADEMRIPASVKANSSPGEKNGIPARTSAVDGISVKPRTQPRIRKRIDPKIIENEAALSSSPSSKSRLNRKTYQPPVMTSNQRKIRIDREDGLVISVRIRRITRISLAGFFRHGGSLYCFLSSA